MSANEELNVACFGVGGKGGSDSANAATFGNVLAICDVDRNTLEGKGKSKGFENAEKFTDFRELLDRSDLDAVLIATGPNWHTTASVYAAQAGKDIYCEKPCSKNVD